jgi:CheY-like chemotaxis protein
MGGTIDFESEPLKGSRFFFALPAEPAESAPSAVSAAPAPKAKPCSSLAGKRILLVEDYKVNQMVFSAYLHELGCQVEVASDGQEGVTAFTRREFDLILMDIQMPVLDGWSATREIRTLERAGGRKQTPIIALTASALTGDHERCLAAGCTAFLQKPVRKAEMIESVERLISLAEENSPTPIRGGAGPPYDAVIESLRPEFIEELGATILRIRASFAAADYGESGRCAHQLVGAGATFGFPEVTRIGRLLEQAAQRGDRTESLALADQLETIWQTIKQ